MTCSRLTHPSSPALPRLPPLPAPTPLCASSATPSTPLSPSQILKRLGAYNPKKLFGVTSLDVVRANTFIAENQGFDVTDVNVPVVGGHAGTTILPLLSQVPNATFSQEDREALTHRIMFGGDEVVQAKAGGGSATLSMAWAGCHFALQVIRAANGESGIVECSYVDSDVTSVPFFSSPVELGREGIAKIHPVPEMNEFEQQKFDEMVPVLTQQVEKGFEFAKTFEL